VTVVDASALVEALVSDSDAGNAVRERMVDAASLEAPHLLDVEVLSALRRLQSGGLLDSELAESAVNQLRDLPVTRFPHVDFARRIWELKEVMTPYDASYVALAEAAGEPLVTLDSRLAKAPGLGCEIDLVR